MRTALTLFLLLPSFLNAQQDSVLSGSYEWKLPEKIKYSKLNTSVLLQGKVHDFSQMQISANFMGDKRGRKLTVPDTVEQVLIIKSGWCRLFMNDTTYSLTPGSVAVLMPGQKFTLQTGNRTLEFFSMQYKSRNPAEQQRLNKSFVKIWEQIAFKPNNNGGGRRDFFETPTPMQKRFEMHVTTLKEGLKSHEPHTHRAEEIVWILEGDTEMQVGDKIVKTGQWGFYYLGSNVSHAIKNIGTKPTTYFAFQFE